MVSKHLLEEMTFLEFRERLAGDPVILLPLGSQEEQGPIAPMGDFMLTRALAARIAEQTGAIAAPTLPFGHADYFRAVPGGMQLSADSFRGVLRDMVESFLDHGLHRLLVFNGHSGNHGLIDVVLREIRRDRGVMVPWVNVWRMIPPEIWQQAHGADAARARGHGGDPVTSVYKSLFPALMRDDLATTPAPGRTVLGMRTTGVGAASLDGLEVNLPLYVTEHCDDGIIGGDPALASAAAGQAIAGHIVAASVKLVRHLQTVAHPGDAG